jgi:hypothetical protein
MYFDQSFQYKNYSFLFVALISMFVHPTQKPKSRIPKPKASSLKLQVALQKSKTQKLQIACPNLNFET